MEQLPPHNMLDIFLFVIMALGLLQGLRRKLSGEMARFLGTGLSVWAGWYFYHPLGQKIQSITRLSEEESGATAFFVSLVGVFIAVLLLRIIFGKIMEVTFKGGALQYIGGALAGLLRTMLACAALLFFMNLLPSAFIRQSVSENSFFGRIVTRQIPEWWHSIHSVYPDAPELPVPADPATMEVPAVFDAPEEEIPADE